MGRLVDVRDGLVNAGYFVITKRGRVAVSDGDVQIDVMLAGTSTANARSRQRNFWVDVWRMPDESQDIQALEDDFLTTLEAIEDTLLSDCDVRFVTELGRIESEELPKYAFGVRLQATVEF